MFSFSPIKENGFFKKWKEVMKVFDIDKIRSEVNQIQKENSKEKSKRGLSTLLQFYKGKEVEVFLNNSDETIDGILSKYSMYELEIMVGGSPIVIWKHNIRYMVVRD